MRFLAKKCENIAKSRQKMIPEGGEGVKCTSHQEISEFQTINLNRLMGT